MNLDVIKATEKAAEKFKVPAAHALAVVQIESAGKAFEDALPRIRWEGHYFYRLLKNSDRAAAVQMGLASPKMGAVKNPSSNRKRFTDLLEPAKAIDHDAAISSASWGLGQVMGVHWKDLGYRNTNAFVEAMQTVEGQIEVMFRFCKENGLIPAIQRGDWVKFASGYNGPAYRKNRYDTKLAEAAAYWREQGLAGPKLTHAERAEEIKGMLRRGTEGAHVRELQTLLVRAGHPTAIDGVFGQGTESAVRSFQKTNKLKADGIVGPATEKALAQYKDQEEALASVGPVEAVGKTAEGRQGAATVGGGAALVAAVEPVRTAIEPLTGSGGWIDTVYVAIVVLGAVAVIVGVIWAAVGWRKANTTRGVE